MQEKKYQGARLRSKARYMVVGEKCTKFFFDLEKSKGKAETIKAIKGENGKIEKIEQILEEVKAFYEKLFSAEGVDEEEKGFLLNQIEARVGEERKKQCDQEIREEIEKAIAQLNRRKSPGIDGRGGVSFTLFLRMF